MRQVALALTSVAVVVAAAVLGLFLWLRTYAPLTAVRPIQPGAGLAADVEPTYGSGGKTVYVPIYQPGRIFTTTFTLRNTGRFAVTIKGVAAAEGPLAPVGLVAADALRLRPHDAAVVTVQWRLRCRPQTGQVAADRLPIRYSYLSLFTRTERVELPFAVTLRCSGAPWASP